MGLATIIRKEKVKQSEFRILILGLDNAGKSTVLDRWIKSKSTNTTTGRENSTEQSSISPTFGFEIKTILYDSGGSSTDLPGAAPIRLNFWDIGGQKSIRPFWRNYYEETDAVVWVVDSADLDRLEMCKKELETVLNADRLLGASLLILANKQDSPSALSLESIRNALGLAQLDGKHHHWAVYGTSAVKGMNIEESLRWLVKEVTSMRFK